MPRRSGTALHVVGVLGLLPVAYVATTSSSLAILAPAVGGLLLLLAFQRSVLAWRSLVGALAVVVMLVPARRYALPVNLPYNLEPYRILVLGLAGAVVVSLLIDPRLRLRRLGFGGWFGLYVLAAVLSLVPNYSKIAAMGADERIVGNIAALLTFPLAFAAVRLVLHSKREVHALLGGLAVTGAIVGIAAVLERRSGQNPIYGLDSILPLAGDAEEFTETAGAERFGRARAFGSANHPVALGAVMVLLLPISAYLARHAGWPRTPLRRQQFWLVCAALQGAAIAMSVTRLAFVALAAVAVVGWRMRPETARMGAKLAIPMFCATLLVGAGAVSDLWEAFRPEGGLIAEQSVQKSARSSGRIADLRRVGNSLEEAPIVGGGDGLRSIDTGSSRLILDNEYYGRIVDTGVVGFAAFLGLVLAPIRRMARFARLAKPDPPVSDLAVALCCSFVGFAVGLFFYDGLAFTQVVLVFSLLLAVAGWLLHDVVQPVQQDSRREPEPTPLAGSPQLRP
jgi:hypothetical protein